MKVLITGSSGRIGSAIARCLNNKTETICIDNKPGSFTTLLVDIREKEKVFECVKEVDAVIHCAALLTPHIGLFSENEFWQVNVKGTENLLEACLKHNVKRFVFTSTTSVYGDALVHPNKAVWVTEELLPNPRDIYDETKIAAENLCLEASKHERFPSRTIFQGFLKQWFPYLRPIPVDQKDAFLTELLDHYLTILPADEQGRVSFIVDRLEVEAIKVNRSL